MSDLIAKDNVTPIERALVMNDLSKLSAEQRADYYNSVCGSLGLNPLTQPFQYINLNGKLTLYAKRDATEQLRKVHNVSITIVAREKLDDVYVVTARAVDGKGRTDESIGAVPISGLKGDNLANAFMKAETKAKRRVTLSVCGLGLLDETEVDTIPNAQKFTEVQDVKEHKAIEYKKEPVKEVIKTTNDAAKKLFIDACKVACDGLTAQEKASWLNNFLKIPNMKEVDRMTVEQIEALTKKVKDSMSYVPPSDDDFIPVDEEEKPKSVKEMTFSIN